MINEQEFKEWLDSPTIEPLTIKKEYQALKAAGDDTVTITMEKYGESVQFRYKAQRFEKDLCLYFNDIRIKYRGDVARLFSKQEGLPFENITEIVYGNKYLYTADPYIPERDMGMKQTM